MNRMGGVVCNVNNRKRTNIQKEIYVNSDRKAKNRKVCIEYEPPIYKGRNTDGQQHVK